MTKNALAGFPEAERLYFWSIHDGMDLLRAHAPTGSVATFDMSNPFNALLGRRPPRGLNVILADGRTIGIANHPPAEALLGDADIVMVPAYARNPASEAVLLRLYQPYIMSHFEVAARDRFWTMYSRHSPAGT